MLIWLLPACATLRFREKQEEDNMSDSGPAELTMQQKNDAPKSKKNSGLSKSKATGTKKNSSKK